MSEPSASGITIRALSELPDLAEAVRLQREIWGFEEIELLPVRLFVVATKVGGQVYGAFDRDRMIGFLLAIPGMKPGGVAYLHSHMMGILPPYRNRGVGRLLKLTQREDALRQGIRLIEWTFDPLELKNAFFNIERLGAVVRRFVLNQYGTTTSHLHGGLPTDRCIAEWHIDHPRTEAVLAGTRPAFEPEAEIVYPSDIDRIRREEPAAARRIQGANSEKFVSLLGAGLAAVGFERREDSGVYLLGRWPSE